MDWGTAFTAFGTVGALLGTFVALRKAQDRKREQARHVSAWLGEDNGRDRGGYWHKAHVRNGSYKTAARANPNR